MSTRLWTPGTIVPPREFTADEIDLFRFSAVTWNAHRIHYDRDRALSEGLSGLPVQAHLHGAWLGQVARSLGGSSARLRSLTWANRAPVVAGDRVEISGTVEQAEEQDATSLLTLALVEKGADGNTRVEATATVEVERSSA